MKAVLVLEDGTWYTGESFGSQGETCGEIVFNTCMSGYQEITSDPSYNGQMVCMTYPLIGNYGFNKEDMESYKTHLEGFIVKELCEYSNNWRDEISPQEYFEKNNIVGISSIDTRALTQHIRIFGSMYGIISTNCGNINMLLETLKAQMSIKRNLVEEVTTKEIINKKGSGMKVALLDLGVKYNIIRSLQKRDCDVTIFPADTSPNDLLKMNPDGLLISNGPGDPADLPEITKTLQDLMGKKPILGICLGHQLLGRALGGDTYKLKFGHHGGNHPVKDLVTGKCYITSQNHNYALKENFSNDITITHVNVNDKTVEGFRHNTLPIMSVQYHPEAAPGPEESVYIFDEFVELCKHN